MHTFVDSREHGISRCFSEKSLSTSWMFNVDESNMSERTLTGVYMETIAKSECGGIWTTFGASSRRDPLSETAATGCSPRMVALAETSPAPDKLSIPSEYQSDDLIRPCKRFVIELGTTPTVQPSPMTQVFPEGCSVGRCWRTSAAIPATYGDAMDVPDLTLVAPLFAVVFAASILEPGARKSIPSRSSPVGPTLE